MVGSKCETTPGEEKVRSRPEVQRSSESEEDSSLTGHQDFKKRERLWWNQICIVSKRVESADEGQPGGNINLR